jgi:hypothetical protein
MTSEVREELLGSEPLDLPWESSQPAGGPLTDREKQAWWMYEAAMNV